MSGSTEKAGGNPAQLDRIDFLETSARDATTAFDNLASLERVLGTTGLKQNQALEGFNDSLAEVDQWRERLHDSRAQGVGFAAPGGFFTRSLYEAILLKNMWKVT